MLTRVTLLGPQALLRVAKPTIGIHQFLFKLHEGFKARTSEAVRIENLA
jgi:hypothetical protein